MQRRDDRLTVIAYDIGGLVVVVAARPQHVKDHFLRLFADGTPDLGEALKRIHVSASLGIWSGGRGKEKRRGVPALQGSLLKCLPPPQIGWRPAALFALWLWRAAGYNASVARPVPRKMNAF